ncbi:glycoside hydrolase family 31 protein [Thermogemmatispora onikobensis]|uniref:glycoside hydrolase family 31 protein n=1 Tax=Thermogemmatispora onikobensis TaxID=732234 RepID=UPI0008529E38|nr:TIM-barrel domain-containing protein [Thermogemmatispora onikobensis]
MSGADQVVTGDRPVMVTQGFYLRRLAQVTLIPGGVRAEVALVPFRTFGAPLRPVVVSAEPLAQQMTTTGVPNRPAEAGNLAGTGGEAKASAQDALLAAEAQLRLELQVLAPRIVRLRLGTPETLRQVQTSEMLAPGALEEVLAATYGSQPPFPALEETATGVRVTLEGIKVTLERDPFALQISSDAAPEVAWRTALDDRNVHGLLCTPPPGLQTTPGEQAAAYWSWAIDPAEHFYGLGERFARLDHRGTVVHLFNIDAWGTTTEGSYKNVPFLLSSRGYGLFMHTAAPVTLALGTPSARAALVCSAEPALDLFLFFGREAREVLEEYTRVTGRATLPPRWAFGVWLSRCRYQSRAEVEEVATRARAEGVPCDVLHIDPAWLAHPNLSCDFTVNEEAFPDLPGLIRELGERGFKVSLWELPYISEQAPRYEEAARAGYFLRDEQGEPIGADFGGPPPDGRKRAIVDFTNPAARAWWQDLHRPLLRAGVAVFKTDFGEGVPLEAQAANGMRGHELRNLYPLLYNAAVHEVITQETGRPGLVWGRSGWAGTQRYPAQWGGDPKTDVVAMACSLRGGLNLALSAPGLWAHDIGGFYGPPPSPELYIRWAQFGLFSPLARAHGTTPREPWAFGEEALAIFRRYARLRLRLNPYLYSLAWEAHARGLPMLRPLLLEFPEDPLAAMIDDVYLLGPALLVAPVFSEAREPVARRLYLPAGEWIDFWSDERLEGGRYVTRLAPLEILPVYVRAGSVLPLGPERAFLKEEAPDEVTLEVYPGAPGRGRIVWDASGAATEWQLLPTAADGWQLQITGKRQIDWSVRWHTARGTVTQAVGYMASAVVSL